MPAITEEVMTPSGTVDSVDSTTPFLRKTNNLSDVANANTSLANLGGTAAGIEVFTSDDVASIQTYLNFEDGADVTDATNVAAAGAVMDGDFSTNGIMKRTGAGAYGTATDGTDYYSPTDSNLTALSGLTLAADKLLYSTGVGALATADLSSYMRGLLDNTTAAGFRTEVDIQQSIDTTVITLANSADDVLVQAAIDGGAKRIFLSGTTGAFSTQLDIDQDDITLVALPSTTINFTSTTGIYVTANNAQFIGGWSLIGPGGEDTYTAGRVGINAAGTDTDTRLEGFVCGIKVSGTASVGVQTKFVNGVRYIPGFEISNVAYAGIFTVSCDRGRVDGGFINVLDAVGASSNAYGISLTHTSTGYSSEGSRIYDAYPAAGGSSYVVGDTLTASGGTGTAATFEVIAVSAGAVTRVMVTSGGDYTALPSSPISTTGGTGTGCTLTIYTELNPANPFCKDWVINGLTVQGPRIWQAIDTHGCFEVSVINCKVYASKLGISLTASSGDATNYAGQNNTAFNNTVSTLGVDGLGKGVTPAAAFTINGGSAVSNRQCRIIGNIIDGYGSTGLATGGVFVATAYANNFIISQNIIKRWYGAVFAIGTNCTGWSINDNIIDGMALSTETVGYIVSLTGSGYTNSVINGNVHNPLTGTAATWFLNGSGTKPATPEIYMGVNQMDHCSAGGINSAWVASCHGPGHGAIITIADGATTLDVSAVRSCPMVPITFYLPTSGITANVTITDITGETRGQRVKLLNDNATYNLIFTRSNAALDGSANITLGRFDNAMIYKGALYWHSETATMANG